MILQALTQHYEDLLKRQANDCLIPKFGYSMVSVSGIAQIDQSGKLISLIPANADEPTKKRNYLLPLQLKRSGSSPPPYFLSDNAQYVFGIEKDGATPKSIKRFELFKSLHENILKDETSPEVVAFRNFLKRWNPQSAENSEILAGAQGFLFNGQIVFRVLESANFLHDVPSVLERWNRYYETTLSSTTGVCLVTGRTAPIARIHNSVKGIKSNPMQPNGWTLVSFDKGSPALSSYGKKQGENAPVSEYAAFAYTAALNHLLADRNNVQFIGDTTVVCWAEGAEPDYQTLAIAALFGQEVPGLTDNDLRAALRRLANGLPCEELGLDPERPFYILGLAPNAARLSVRFFLRDTFGSLMKHINEHYERLEILRPSFAKPGVLSLWALLRETVNMKSKDKSPSPAMAGATARAVFSGGPYPASLLEAVMLRIRAEREITWGRAAIIKAYYLKNPHPDCPEEVLTVSLNEESTNLAYTLGRLFSVYEAVQQTANPGINATIKDKFFNSASAMPASIFPVLNNLYQKHLRKLDAGMRVYYDRQVSALKSILGEQYPTRMNLAQQGSFDLGYYHQTQKRYTKKEDKENG